MPYYWCDPFWLGEPVYDATMQVFYERQGDATARVWRTPAGKLREETAFLPASCFTGCAGAPVQTERDLDALSWLAEHRHLEPRCLRDYERRRAL